MVNDVLDNFDDLVHGLGGLRMDRSRPDAQAPGINPIFVDIAFRNGFIVGILLIGPLDDFIVDIGEVLNEKVTL